MSGRTRVSQEAEHFVLCFPSLHAEDLNLSFPCDANGHVDMDTLSEAGRQRYFYARTVVGREFSPPELKRTGRQAPQERGDWEPGE